MSSHILSILRGLMKNVGYKEKSIQALIVTNHDAHMSEYLADSDKRLKYVSGFSGSSGTAVITENDALMWTDGRYFIQAEQQMDFNWNLMKVGVHGTPTEGMWLSRNLPAGSLVGTDPSLIPYSVWLNMEKELEHSGVTLVPLASNFVDMVWVNKPSSTLSPVWPLDIKYAGESSASKFERVLNAMKERGVDLLVLSALDDISWLLNLRGDDIEFNPVFFSFLIIRVQGELDFFVHEDKIPNNVRKHLEMDNNLHIKLRPYDSIYSALKDMEETCKKAWICRSASYQIYDTFPETKRFCECSPVTVMKSVKNETEVKGLINAHVKDGVALCRFYSYIENIVVNNESFVTETGAANVLESYRRDEENYVGPSFQTISSSGPHAAIIHHVATEESDRFLNRDEIFLCDAGGQYLDGTTDVTRTMHFGIPTEFQKECFTRVFKGLVALATAVFPYGIKGNCLDSFARKPLWDVGLDYKHGTGHGIGAFLLVHEGPMGISWRPYPDDPGLRPNMFLSDEPGYYHDGEFGIRIENIVRIVRANTAHNMPLLEKGFLTFDTQTLVPIQTKMLNISLLTAEEIRFLNSYHRKVLETLGPILQRRGYNEAYQWLEKETAEITA